jgi:hypothetical protein
MAHPKRKRQALALHRQLIKYPFSHVRIIWDEQNDEWHTGARALRCGASTGGWHVVIQDDAVLTPEFFSNIEGIVDHIPVKSVVSLYTGKVRPLADRVKAAVDRARDGEFLNHYMLMWGVGILLPSAHIEPLLDFIDEARYHDTPYDQRIGIFYQRNMLPIYYCIPSLVDHNDHLGSLIGNGYAKEPRVAHRLATGRVNWTDMVIDL